MEGLVDTGLGKIAIDTDVIATYAGSVAVECFGIVGMAAVSMKDGLVKLLKRDSLKHGITKAAQNRSEIQVEVNCQIAKDINCQIAVCHIISFGRSIQRLQNCRKKRLKQNRHKEGEGYRNAQGCGNQTLCFFLVLRANRLGDQN